MRLLFMPRPDRPYDEKVASLMEAGFTTEVYVRHVDERMAVTSRLSEALKRSEMVLVEFPVVAASSGPGSYQSWAWVRKNFPTKRLVLWVEEIRHPGDYFPQFEQACPAFNDVFVNYADPSTHHDWRRMGIRGIIGTMYGSAELGIAERVGDITPDHEVTFAGRLYMSRSRSGKGAAFPLADKRATFLREIDKHFKLAIAGDGWAGFKHHYGRINDRPAVYHFLKRGKVVFGMNQFDLTRYYPERVWQSLATGRASLTHYIPGMEKDFTLGVEIASFKSVDELLKKIEQLLQGDRWRVMGEAGLKLLRERHRWVHRYRDLHDVVTKPWLQNAEVVL